MLGYGDIWYREELKNMYAEQEQEEQHQEYSVDVDILQDKSGQEIDLDVDTEGDIQDAIYKAFGLDPIEININKNWGLIEFTA